MNFTPYVSDSGGWLKHYATNIKVTDSRRDEGNTFFSLYLMLSAALSPGVYSTPNRTEYQKMFLGSRAQPTHRDHNFTAICEPIV
jgi:hypothetical protein